MRKKNSVNIWNAYCVQVLLALDRIEHDDELSYEVRPVPLFAMFVSLLLPLALKLILVIIFAATAGA
jgi:hypothetical protein